MSGAQPVIVLFGPTAVGKTELLVELFAGKAEIINADSRQVYRHLDIGTAKPGPEITGLLPHHLIDVVDPSVQYTAGDFVHGADSLVPQVAERGLAPVVAGGTGFYLRNFIYGLPQTPPAFPAIRKQLHAELRDRGVEALYSELVQVDPVTAGRVPKSDVYRIERAVEVYRGTKRPLSSFRIAKEMRSCYRFLLLGIERERSDLYERIDRRVDSMVAAGLLDEIKRVKALGYAADDPGLKTIGYREVLSIPSSGCCTLLDAVELIKRNSRRYAKRQITFLRNLRGARWYDANDRGGIRSEVERFLLA